MDKKDLIRGNTKLVSSVNEPVYTIPYLTAQARNGLVNVSSVSFAISLASTIVCQIANNSTNNMTSVEGILVNSTGNISYSLIRNGTLTGTVSQQSVFNVNDSFSAATTTTVKAASATAGLSVSGGNTLLEKISLPNVFNAADISPIIIKPGSTLYFTSTGLTSISVALNVFFTVY